MPAPALRVALYARVSTTGHGQDIGLQLEELRRVAAQRGLAVVGEYTDEGVSGIKVSRPGLDLMLAEAQAGRFDLLMVWKLDRLGRSLQHVLTVLDTLSSAGVGFASIRDAGIDTTSPSGRLLLQLLAAFAQFERDLIQERVLAGVRRAQAAGKHCGRPRVVPADQALRASRQLLQQGWSLRQAARAVGVSKDTLRRRLAEAELLSPLAQNPTVAEVSRPGAEPWLTPDA